MGWDWVPGAMEQLEGIEPYEVLQALVASKRWPRNGVSRNTGMMSLTICARTRAGRPLMVGLIRLQGFEGLIYSAKELHGEQLAEFEAWEATR